MRPEAPVLFPSNRQTTRPNALKIGPSLRKGQAQLCVRAKIDGKWKMVSATAPDRTVLPQGVGWHRGQRIKATGRYYIRVVANGQNKWLPAGERRDEALVRREDVKQALAAGHDRASIAISGSHLITSVKAPRGIHTAATGPVRLRDEAERAIPQIGRKIAEFLEAKEDPRRADRAPRTVHKYEVELHHFTLWCAMARLNRIEEVTRQDLLDYADFRERRGAKKNVSRRNILLIITGFLRWHRIVNPLGPDDLPRAEVTVPEEFSEVEVDALLAAAKDETERATWKFLLMTGARENECARAEWGDIDFDRGAVTIRPHPPTTKRGVYRPEHRLKDRERRELPLHPDLAQALLELKVRNRHVASDDLVFPGRDGRIQGHLLRELKRCAKRAGLNPERAWLHKFRSTFISRLILNTDVDIPTILQWAGHSGIGTTIRHYIARRDAASARSKAVIARAFEAAGAAPISHRDLAAV